MKIQSATIYQVAGEGLKPVLVTLRDADGTEGVGEAAIAYGSGGSGAAGMIKDLLTRFVIGKDVPGINALTGEMYDQSFWLKNPGGIAGAALSAIEMALWDIRGKALGVPVYDLFGGRMRDDLPCYANGWYFGATSDAEIVRMAEATVADGFDWLKMYPFARVQPNGTLRHPVNRDASDPQSWRRAADLVRAVHGVLGPTGRLCLDFGGGIALADTIYFLDAVSDLDIEFIEEVGDPGDFGALERIASQTRIPVATGERQYLRMGFRDLLERRCVDILQPDIGNTGGFAEAYKIAAMADAYSLKVQPHVCGSTVAVRIAAHLSACIPNFYVQEHFPYWDRVPGYVEVARNPLLHDPSTGRLPISNAPGFGIDLDKAALRDHVAFELGG
ncbi:mandelate racemase/muconate lactonizing enzyme family protein [Pacificispira sp.]|uniref:mandelate racemase/muconate lactonizing enzyme family protein n=1 Tax=Pacificispira sp. TaxID=2888761 RepID=UPI003BACE320